MDTISNRTVARITLVVMLTITAVSAIPVLGCVILYIALSLAGGFLITQVR